MFESNSEIRAKFKIAFGVLAVVLVIAPRPAMGRKKATRTRHQMRRLHDVPPKPVVAWHGSMDRRTLHIRLHDMLFDECETTTNYQAFHEAWCEEDFN